MMKLGERLRSIRKEHKLTLKELSQRADLSVPYLSDIERSGVSPSLETLQKIAGAYGMTFKDLFNGVEGLGGLANVTYPKGFLEFVEDPEYKDELNEDWKELLIRINLRGQRPSVKREWVELYLNLRRFFLQRRSEMQFPINDINAHVIKLVRDTVRKYTSAKMPDFDEICSGLGLVAKEVPLSPARDGMIIKQRTILINSRIRNKERKRFTQFHEVMHYLIDEDEELVSMLHDATWDQNGEYERQVERLCNIGAAEFLMPREEFTKLYKEQGFNVELISFAANHFKSSTIAATIQLAQVAPNSCIAAICEYGSVLHETVPVQKHLFNEENSTPQTKLRVVYSASSPATKYWLARNTNIPDDHLIHQAFLEDQFLEEESYVPFRSGNRMPCYCEALPAKDRNRVYALFHLIPPPNPNPDQLTFI